MEKEFSRIKSELDFPDSPIDLEKNGYSANGHHVPEPELVLVDSVVASDRATIVTSDLGTEVTLRPYLYLKSRDTLEFQPSVEAFQTVTKRLPSIEGNSHCRVKVHPPFQQSFWVHVPPHKFLVTIRERTGRNDRKSIKILEQFHYRGKGLNRIIGRRVVLIAECEEFGVIGYGVLSSTLGIAKPRFALFNTNFTEQMKTKLINRLARIPRIVIHPEFRGMGLGVAMARSLVEYARGFWDVNGYTPIAIEVIASMTEYHRFFEAAGFVKAGETRGYKNGIVPRYGTGTWGDRPNSASYKFLTDQKPKPYLIYPMNDAVRGALMDNGLLSQGASRVSSKPKPTGSRISLQRIWVEYKSTNRMTARAKEVMEAFDVDSRQLRSPVLRNLSLTVDPGEVVLVTGGSGSGKSTILKLITTDPRRLVKSMEIRGKTAGLCPSETAQLTNALDDRRPLIDQVGTSVKESIAILNSVGLAEAHLYVKRPSQLSDGQKYRFAVALLCDSKKSIWVADEFASSLDPLTAAVVAKGIRKRGWESGSSIVLSAPHVTNFVESLVPNKIIKLRWGGIAETVSINCRFKVTNDSVELKVRNTGREELTDVTLFGVNSHGEREPIEILGDIAPKSPALSLTIPSDQSDKFQTLVVFTDQQVGDIFHLL